MECHGRIDRLNLEGASQVRHTEDEVNKVLTNMEARAKSMIEELRHQMANTTVQMSSDMEKMETRMLAQIDSVAMSRDAKMVLGSHSSYYLLYFSSHTSLLIIMSPVIGFFRNEFLLTARKNSNFNLNHCVFQEKLDRSISEVEHNCTARMTGLEQDLLAQRNHFSKVQKVSRAFRGEGESI